MREECSGIKSSQEGHSDAKSAIKLNVSRSSSYTRLEESSSSRDLMIGKADIEDDESSASDPSVAINGERRHVTQYSYSMLNNGMRHCVLSLNQEAERNKAQSTYPLVNLSLIVLCCSSPSFVSYVF